MNIGIIGSGLQAKRRIEAIRALGEDEILIVGGINQLSLDAISKKYEIKTTLLVESLFQNPEIEVIVICTPPNSHGDYLRKALLSGKKVLVEKPLFQSSDEALSLEKEFSSEIITSVRCGFNHRFHPAISSLKENLTAGVIGNVIFARAIYGISARMDYLSEWRSDPKFAAGGQFIEQGSHILDLFQWMLGKPIGIYCKTTNLIFKDAPLEDGGMAILTFPSGATAQLHTTLGQWHNEFRFEVYGDKGFLRVNGLGNTYGTESLELGVREEGKPFKSEITQFRGSDMSWQLEWQEFKLALKGEKSKIATFQEGVDVMRIAESAYLSNDNSSESRLNL